MAMHLITTVTIEATPEQVWKVLTDFEKYPEWNPFVKKLTGRVAVGNRISIELPGMNFKPVVLKFEKPGEFRWLGKLLFKGLFDGEHYFKIIDNNNGTCTFEHGEIFKGILIPIFKGGMLNKTKEGFEQMNRALKGRVEQSVKIKI